MGSRTFIHFAWKQAHYRICSEKAEEITGEIPRLRSILEEYIARCSEFGTSFSPLTEGSYRGGLPDIVRRMKNASEAAGVGPMAAVAGTIAQMAAEKAIRAGAAEAIVENGGDMYLWSPSEIVTGLYAGKNRFSDKLALYIPGESLPLAICSSSGLMGHSASLGTCDLATVFSKDASLADAAATLAGNLVQTEEDIEPALERIMGIENILGVLLVKGDKLGLAGEVPEIVENRDPDLNAKISKDENSNF